MRSEECCNAPDGGIYFLPSVRFDPSVGIRAAWISFEPQLFLGERWQKGQTIVVSHESAASIHGIGEIIPRQHSFSSAGRKQSAQQDIRLYNNQNFEESDVVSIDGLPVTSVERTLADLAAQKIERNYLATLVADGLQKEGVRYRAAAKKLSRFAKYYGSSSGVELLDAFQEEAVSQEDKQEIIDRAMGSGLIGDFFSRYVQQKKG